MDSPSNRNLSSTSVSVVSGKGGTGKSIITASIGYILAHIGFRTLIIDTDLYTAGISFFLLADSPTPVEKTLRSFLEEENTIEQYEGTRSEVPIPVVIDNDFVNGNLYLLPSMSSFVDFDHIFDIDFSKETFSSTFAELITAYQQDYGFEYILFDTRGGTDKTSMAAVQATKGVIMVTEADKTSWDVGEVILRGIDMLDSPIINYGFVINKNVLENIGAQAIEAMLKRRWKKRHLATIPLDKEAVASFQEDKVPIAIDLSMPFNIPIVNGLLPSVFSTTNWTKEHISKFEILKDAVNAKSREEEFRREQQKRVDRLVRMTILAFMSITLPLVIVLTTFTVDNKTLPLFAVIIMLLSATLVLVLSTNSEPLFRLIDLYSKVLRKLFMLPSSSKRN